MKHDRRLIFDSILMLRELSRYMRGQKLVVSHDPDKKGKARRYIGCADYHGLTLSPDHISKWYRCDMQI